MAKEVEIQGLKELQENIDKFVTGFHRQAKVAIEKAASNTAEDIKVIFKGGAAPGFKDRSGALRESIVGGLDDQATSEDEIVGFVGAGNDLIGSSKKRTREYVEAIEFGEFSKAGSTSFLRAGVQMQARQIQSILAEELKMEKIL